MANKKNNRRVQFTKSALRKALADLSAEMPLSSITVTDICAHAGVNRSTFYLHYQGVHELLHEIEDDIIQHMQQSIDSLPLNSATFAAMLTKMRSATRLQKLIQALVSEQGDPQFVRRLHHLIYVAFQRRWEQEMPDVSEGRKLLVYSFTVSGVIAALSVWMTDDEVFSDMSALDAVNLIHSLLQHGSGGLGFVSGTEDDNGSADPSPDMSVIL